jgi:Mn-dependent DtxR family transcriptional regulator
VVKPKQRVHDAMKKLQDSHLVRLERGEWSLTDKGKKAAQKCA